MAEFNVMKPADPTKKPGAFLMWLAIMVVVITVVIAGVMWAMSLAQDYGALPSSTTDKPTIGGAVAEGQQIIQLDDNVGDSATITVNAYDVVANTQTEVGVPLGVYDQDGTKLQDVDSYDSGSTITNAIVGDVISMAGGNASFYVDAMELVPVDKVQVTVNLDAATIAAESSISLIGYDKTGTTALTAHGNTTRADYTVSLGANQETKIYLELTNDDDNSRVQTKAFCSGTEGNVSYLMPAETSLWEDAIVPEGISDGVSWYDGTDMATTADYDKCWRLKETVKLDEYDDKKWAFLIKGKGTDPTTDAGNQAFGIFLDGAYAEGSDGKMYFDYYQHDTDQSITAVGMAETSASPAGREIGVLIDVS